MCSSTSLIGGSGRLTPAERAAQGKEARAVVPRGPGLPHTKAELPEDIEQGKIVPERIANTDPAAERAMTGTARKPQR